MTVSWSSMTDRERQVIRESYAREAALHRKLARYLMISAVCMYIASFCFFLAAIIEFVRWL